MTGTATRMFSANPTFVPAGPLRADRLNGEAVAEHGVMAYLVQLGVGERQPRSNAQVHRLPAANLHVDSLIATFDERGELVDREVVLHPVAELLGHVAGVVRERFRRVG